MGAKAKEQPVRNRAPESPKAEKQSLREKISVLPLESLEARTAYSFAATFAEELKLVYASRQQRAESVRVERASWSDRLIQVARAVLSRKASRLDERGETSQASAQAGAGA